MEEAINTATSTLPGTYVVCINTCDAAEVDEGEFCEAVMITQAN